MFECTEFFRNVYLITNVMMVSVALMCAVSPNIAAVDICVPMNVETESTYDITYILPFYIANI